MSATCTWGNSYCVLYENDNRCLELMSGLIVSCFIVYIIVLLCIEFSKTCERERDLVSNMPYVFGLQPVVR